MHEVLKCETDEPDSMGFGAYISTCPLGAAPARRMPLFATTAAPTQCRSSVSVAEAARCTSVIADHIMPVLWSSRLSMNVSFRPLRRTPVEVLTKVWKPRPWPSSCSTTDTKSMRLADPFPSMP
jgi:hypothetical protein